MYAPMPIRILRRPRSLLRLLIVFALFLSAAGASAEPNLVQEKKLPAANAPYPFASFGTSVAINGTTAVVGAPMGVDDGTSRGQAFVFTWDGTAWSQQAVLVPSDGQFGDRFGYRVAIDGDTILVGAIFAPAYFGYGAAYVFERSGATWNQTAKLQFISAVGDGQLFGSSVALEGDRALIGASSTSKPGVAVIVERVGGVWNLLGQTILGLANGAAGDMAVALEGDLAVIGAPRQEVGGPDEPGRVAVFQRDAQGGWNALATVHADDGAAHDGFGSSVAIDGGTIVVGAPFKNAHAGAVYVFQKENGTWSSALSSTLGPASAQAGARFGASVATRAGFVIAGAWGQGSNQGAVHVFDDLTGTSSGKTFLASDGSPGDDFGFAVALDDNRVAVGALLQPAHGAAYVYNLTGGPSRLIDWKFTLWPYRYIYMGCPLLVEAGATVGIHLERGTVPLRFEILSAPRQGTLRFVSDDLLEYQPARGFTGPDAFTIKVTDLAGVTVQKTANVTVVAAER